jgi:hypothetical protein
VPRTPPSPFKDHTCKPHNLAKVPTVKAYKSH